jgi:recombination protein RecA
LRRIESIKVGNEMVGNRIRARVVKNKVAAPFKVAELEILFNQGISKEGALLDLGVEMDILKKSGSFFSFGQIRLGQGREASRNFLIENTEIRDEIERSIRAQNSPAPESPAAAVEEAEAGPA